MEHFYDKMPGLVWFDFQEFYSMMVRELPNNSHIVEVGAYKGRSTAYLAVEVINSGKNIKIDVVDTWNGSDDFGDPNTTNPDYVNDPEFIEFDGNLLPIFKRNVAPVLHLLNPIQLPSTEAAKLYEDKSLDFVFIDANHRYEYVKEDIFAWTPKIKLGGLIAGHDYNHGELPGVTKAVNEIFGNKIQVIKPPRDGGSVWLMRNSNG